MFRRPRRNRKLAAIRDLMQETHLYPSDLIAPFFLLPGINQKEEIQEMPGVFRLSTDLILKEAEALHLKGVPAIALFPVIDPRLKCLEAKEAINEDGLIPQAIRTLKRELPSLCIMTDIALDPYTSHGHDGIINEDKEIDNDLTLEVLNNQAVVHALSGADIVAPSDMMDGRVQTIRQALDKAGFTNTGILSYTAKYATSLYSPFRSAIKTSLQFGDKRSYQLNPANVREAMLEATIDIEEGADMLMIKPALFYLDVITKVKQKTHLPLGAYHVSGEYAMVMAAHQKGYLDATDTFYEALLCIKRAGADFIYTYAIPHILDRITSN